MENECSMCLQKQLAAVAVKLSSMLSGSVESGRQVLGCFDRKGLSLSEVCCIDSSLDSMMMLRGRCGELNHVLSLRRYEAAGWLRKMVGVVAGKDLPAEPSEEHFRIGLRSGIILCNVLKKIQPGAVPKVVEAPNDSMLIPDGAALMAYQYFENVKNFLHVIEEMGLPTFHASDLDQVIELVECEIYSFGPDLDDDPLLEQGAMYSKETLLLQSTYPLHILTLSENGNLQRNHDKWLSNAVCSGENRLSLQSFRGMFLTMGMACFVAILYFFCKVIAQYCKFNKEDTVAKIEPSVRPRSAMRLSSFRELMVFVDRKEDEVKEIL
ncbi:hypothetical protein Drorol1_Dr00006909 [Drosera rotundifolia]